MFIGTVNEHLRTFRGPFLILHFPPVPALAVLALAALVALLQAVPLAAQPLVAAPLPLLAAVQRLAAEQLQPLVAVQQLHCMPRGTNNGAFSLTSSQVGIVHRKYLKPPEQTPSPHPLGSNLQPSALFQAMQ